MADELTISASLAYADSEGADELLAVADVTPNVSTKKYAKFKQSVGTSEEALGLGEVTSLGYCLVINRDETNFVQLRTGTGGTYFAKLLPGEVALFRFGSGVTAPFVIADTAAYQIEVFLIST